jgi:hypothetical protein
MEQLKLSLACLKNEVAVKYEEKMTEANILRDDNSDIILLNYGLLKNTGKLKQSLDLKTIEDKKIIVVFNEKLKADILSNLLFKKNIIGIIRFDEFNKIREIIDSYKTFDNKKILKGEGESESLIKELAKGFKGENEENGEDPLLKFVIEHQFAKTVPITEVSFKNKKEFSYYLNCKVNEKKLLIVGLFLALYEKDKVVVLKDESLRLKYGIYITPTLKTSGKGDLEVFVKTDDLIINSSKKIDDKIIEKLQKMIEN